MPTADLPKKGPSRCLEFVVTKVHDFRRKRSEQRITDYTYVLSEPELGELHLASQTILQDCVYRMPYWTDTRDFANDDLCISAARALVQEKRNDEIKSNRRNSDLTLVAGVLLPVLVGVGIWTYESVLGSLIAMFFYLLVVLFLIASIGVLLNSKDLIQKQCDSLKNSIAIRSRADYEVWKMDIAISDRDLYFKVVEWEHQQEVLEVQRKMLVETKRLRQSAERSEIHAAEAAANTAKIAKNSEVIRRNQRNPWA